MNGIEGVISAVVEYIPDADTELIRRAYEYAADIHGGVMRRSGRPYIEHPIGVALLVTQLHLDVPSICAALLHDVKEDAGDRPVNLEERFGIDIARIVDGVTKLDKYQFTSQQEKQAENFKKMLVAMSHDIRVLLVKLCDRLHNMREIEFLSDEKRIENAEETMQIYAPLAERLGIAWVRTELEDLSFRALWPDEYEDLKVRAEARLQERKGFIDDVIARINETLTLAGMTDFDVFGRPKNLYGLYKKMRIQGIDLEHVYDFVAFRVITQRVEQCWSVLGLLHNIWTPIPSRFKDFINVSKPNGYKSLHTSVFGPLGEPMEIQIRTWDMHRIAEAGIAAHWTYKESGSVQMRDQERFNWLRQLIEWAQEVRSPDQFMEGVQESLFTDQVFAFTPKGDLKVMAMGATALDFAYEIHSEVGNTCTGVRINSRLVPLSTPLRSGDLVEVITSKTGQPKRDWLNFVNGSKAKNKIRLFFQEEERAHAQEIGRQLLEKEFRRRGLSFKKVFSASGDDIKRILDQFKIKAVEELFRAVSMDRITSVEITDFLSPEPEKVDVESLIPRATGILREIFKKRSDGIAVDGVEDVLLQLAKCCNPIPGDSIKAFVTRGRGVTIHVSSCPSITNADPERILPAHWVKETGGLFNAPILIRAEDRPGMLAHLTKEISERKANIASISTRSRDDGATDIMLVIQIEDQHRLQGILNGIKRLSGILLVSRLRSVGDV